MIKTLKQTISNIYYWIKKKLIQFKRWLILIIFGAAVIAAPLVNPSVPDIALEKIQADYHASELKDKYRLEKTAFILDAVDENAIQAEVGNKNLDSFEPSLMLRKWDDEVNFRVKYRKPAKRKLSGRLVDLIKKDRVDLEGNKIKFKSDKTEVHFYEMKKGEVLLGKELENDVYEVEVILLEKPDTNIVGFDIETKGLAFYYQPEITEKRKISEANEAYLDEILDIVLKENPQTVLDFGGGKGELAKQLIENGVNTTVIDISQEAYDNRVVDDFILGDIFEELPKMADNSFDLIIDVGVLKYVDKEKADELVSEIKRVSKKSIHFIGYGSWAPTDVEYGEINYGFWENKFLLGEDDADLYKILIDATPYRPENIIGSYAVYHESKQGDYSKMGKKNYRAGKAFHIYRPKIIDSAGTEVWGELDITDNLLTVTIPQEFLDNAVYPIRHAAGLKFGYETIGGAWQYIVDRVTGSQFTGAAGTGDSISAYLTGSTTTGLYKFALYQHSNSDLIDNGLTNEGTCAGSAGWHTQNFPTSPTISAIDYVITVSTEDTYFGLGMYYDDGDYPDATTQGHYETSTYPTFPDPASFTHEDRKYSIYCTYTVGGAEERRMFLTQ